MKEYALMVKLILPKERWSILGSNRSGTAEVNHVTLLYLLDFDQYEPVRL